MLYTNTEDNHFKFWGYDCKEDLVSDVSHNNVWVVTTYWGPIGTPLETCSRKEFYFNTEYDAQSFIETKLNEKRRKGYLPLNKSYEELCNIRSQYKEDLDFSKILERLNENVQEF